MAVSKGNKIEYVSADDNCVDFVDKTKKFDYTICSESCSPGNEFKIGKCLRSYKCCLRTSTDSSDGLDFVPLEEPKKKKL